MSKTISAVDAFQFIRSYGWTPEMCELEQWLHEDPLIQSNPDSVMDEDSMYRFDDWRRYKGTAYEPGIDLQEKVDRLLTEGSQMRKETEELKLKIAQLEQKQIGESPF